MILALIVMYDTILDTIFLISHNLIEWIKFVLEEAVAHFFHTNQHQSEIIVAYLFLVFSLLGLYWFWKALPGLFLKAQNKILAIWMQQKSNLSSRWKALSAKQKIEWSTMAGTGFFGFLFWQFN